MDFTDEEFLHKTIKNKDIYVDYGTTEDIPEYTCSLKVAWKFDSVELK